MNLSQFSKFHYTFLAVGVTGAPTNPAYITPSIQSSAPPPYGVSAAPAHTAYTVTIPQPLADPPKDYLAWSIGTTVLCCSSIVAIIRVGEAIRKDMYY